MSKKLSSHKIRAELTKKVTQTMLDYELFRVNNMEPKALITRLKKIKNPVKAEAMRIMTKWVGLKSLSRKARRRRDELFLAS